MKALLVLVTTLATIGAACADSTEQSQISILIDLGAALLSSEISIAKGDFSNEAAIDIMLKNSGFAWRNQQGDYQMKLYTTLDQYRNLSPLSRDAVNHLLKFNNFAANSMTALTLCNTVEAEWEIRQESQILENLRHEVDSQVIAVWSSSGEPDPKATGGCQ